MIFCKCTNKMCGKKLTEDDFKKLQAKNIKKKVKTCPVCKKKLTFNITEKSQRKRWYGYMNTNKLTVEHLVLVILDEFDDESIDVEIPCLNLFFSTNGHLSVLNIANKEIDDYLKKTYGKSYGNEQQFTTIAFCEETVPIKHQVPVWW